MRTNLTLNYFPLSTPHPCLYQRSLALSLSLNPPSLSLTPPHPWPTQSDPFLGIGGTLGDSCDAQGSPAARRQPGNEAKIHGSQHELEVYSVINFNRRHLFAS